MIDNKGKQNFRNIKRGYAKSKIGCQFVHFRGRHVSPPENMGKQFPFLILFSGRSKAVSFQDVYKRQVQNLPDITISVSR